MISAKRFCMALSLVLLCTATLVAQTTGDFRSAATGNWSAAATWQRYSGSAWVNAASAPTGSELITIQAADSVTIDVPVSISKTLVNQGKLGLTNNLTIANGGTYEHAQNNGSIPVCTWATGSTCKVTGYVSGSKPNNANQNFHHFTWACRGQTANIDLGMSGNTMGGNFTVDTAGTARVYLTSPAAYAFGNPITINGNVIVNGGQFSSNGSSSVDTIEVNTVGNIIVTGGNFSLSRGSGPDVTWKIQGDFSVTNATLQNSGGSTRVNKLSFAKPGTQKVTLTNVTYGSGTSHFTMEVQSGTTLDMGTTAIRSSNSGSFLLRPGATLATGHPGGIDSSIQCTGASNGGGNSLSTSANYTFNGSAAQVTGTLMPTTVNTLTINNPAGVTLSQPTTINGVLRLKAGVFNNTKPFTLGPGGSISFEGGSLLIPVAVESRDGVAIPREFFVDQNYPNPFNPSTTIRFGLPKDSYVTVKVFNLLGEEVVSLFEGRREAGVHSLEFNANDCVSGVYFCRIQAGGSVEVKRMVLMK